MSDALVLLDFDGTLAETETVGYANLVEAIEVVSGRTWPDLAATLRCFHGRTLPDYHGELLRVLGLTPDALALDALMARHVETLYPRFRAATPPAPYLAQGLTQLAHKARLEIATNSDPPRTEAAIAGMEALAPGLAAVLQQCITRINSARIPKPDPQVYMDAITAHGLPSRVVIVEDSASGLAAAAAAREAVGMPVYIVAYTGLHPTPIAHAQALAGLSLADRVIPDRDWRQVAAAVTAALDCALTES